MSERPEPKTAVVLAGGRGTRLLPYTTVLPKPLMPVGEVPILDIVVRQLAQAGFEEVVLSVGHLGELIRAYFHDPSRYPIRIRYSHEDHPLGTAGPLSLIEGLDRTFLVMNGDVLTDLDLRTLLRFHRERGAEATVACVTRSTQIESGVVEADADGRVQSYVEKPAFDWVASMGVYVFEPTALDFVPRAQRLDSPDLILRMALARRPVYRYLHPGCWLDIGREEDYRTAVQTFLEAPERFVSAGSKRTSAVSSRKAPATRSEPV